jgi:hypothetical protein
MLLDKVKSLNRLVVKTCGAWCWWQQAISQPLYSKGKGEKNKLNILAIFPITNNA